MNKLNPYPVTADTNELVLAEKIIPKKHFEKNVNNKELEKKELELENKDNVSDKKGNDRIQCQICDRSYTRYNKTKHNKTKHHIFCTKLNKKWRDSIIGKINED